MRAVSEVISNTYLSLIEIAFGFLPQLIDAESFQRSSSRFPVENAVRLQCSRSPIFGRPQSVIYSLPGSWLLDNGTRVSKTE